MNLKRASQKFPLHILLMTLWCLFFTTAMSLAKKLSPQCGFSLLLFMRCSFGLLFFIPVIIYHRKTILRVKNKRFMLLRSILFLAAVLCSYYGYRKVPLATACSIGFSGPLITTTLSALFLKDHVSASHWAYLIAGYCGILIIFNPNDFSVNYPLLALLGANLIASMILVITRVLRKTESTFSIFFYTHIFGVFISLIAVLFFKEPFFFPDILLMMMVGFFGALSQLCYIQALKFKEPSALTFFEYSRLLFALPIGWFFFGEFPSVSVWIGIIIIFITTILLLRLQKK